MNISHKNNSQQNHAKRIASNKWKNIKKIKTWENLGEAQKALIFFFVKGSSAEICVCCLTRQLPTKKC